MSRVSSLASLALVAASALGAQEPSRTVGFGTSFNPGALIIPGEGELLVFQTGFNNILFPFRGQNFTFEPEFGLFRTSSEEKSTFGTFTSSFTNVRLGVGILKHMEKRENLEPYAGPRFGVVRSTSKETSPFGGSSEQTTKANSWYLSGVLGAQYFFTKHFSLGGEAQLTYTSVGSTTTTGSSNPPDESRSVIGTAGLVLLRCYF